MTTRNPTWVAENFQFFYDTGAAGSSAIGSENAAVNVVNGTKFRLRVAVGETNNATTANVGSWVLQFAVNGGAWTTVGAATTVKYVTSDDAAFVDPNTLSTLLSGVTGAATYQSTWSEQDEDGSLASQTWTDDDTEYEYCLQLNGTSVSDVVTFRMLSPSSSTVTTFTNVPTLTVTSSTQTLTQSATYDGGSQTFYSPQLNLGLSQDSTFDGGSQTLYSPTVAIVQTLTQDATYESTPTFYAPLVNLVLTQDARPDGTPTFYSATVTAQPLTLYPPLVEGQAAFFSHGIDTPGVYFGPTYFGNRWFGPRYWGGYPVPVPEERGAYFGSRYFGGRYFGVSYFGTFKINPFVATVTTGLASTGTVGYSNPTVTLGNDFEATVTTGLAAQAFGGIAIGTISLGDPFVAGTPLAVVSTGTAAYTATVEMTYASLVGRYFGGRYFGARYFGPDYWGTQAEFTATVTTGLTGAGVGLFAATAQQILVVPSMALAGTGTAAFTATASTADPRPPSKRRDLPTFDITGYPVDRPSPITLWALDEDDGPAYLMPWLWARVHALDEHDALEATAIVKRYKAAGGLVRHRPARGEPEAETAQRLDRLERAVGELARRVKTPT